MFKFLQLIPNSFSKKKNVVILFCVLSAIIDLMGIGFLIPLFGLIINDHYLTKLSLKLTLSESSLIVIISTIIFLLFVLKNYFSLYVEKIKLKFTHNVFINISKAILNSYLKRGINVFQKMGSSVAFKNIYHIPFYFSTKILNSYFSIISEIIVSAFLFTFLIYYNYRVFIVISLVVFPLTILYNNLVRKKSLINGEEIDKVSPRLHDSVNNFSLGFMDIIMLQKESYFKDKLEHYYNSYSNLNIERNILLILPNKFMDIVICFCLITIIIVTTFVIESKEDILMTLVSFGVVSLRIIPSINKINASLNFLRLYSFAIPIIQKEFDIQSKINIEEDSQLENIKFNKSFSLNGISKSYNGKKILNKLNFEIKKGQIIGISGDSGSGKTTLVSIIKQILKEDEGEIYVDEIKINSKNVLSWQQKIGFVSQDTFILKGSILENIAFGVQEIDYDYDLIKKVLKLANLEEFVAKRNLNYLLDENGKNISGGQIQRIAIARSLYAQSEILIFDEFTSSIDKKNELKILETVKNLKESNKTIIIISHDKDVFKICDNVLKLNKGVLEYV